MSVGQSRNACIVVVVVIISWSIFVIVSSLVKCCSADVTRVVQISARSRLYQSVEVRLCAASITLHFEVGLCLFSEVC